MLGAFLACSGAVFERGNWAPVFGWEDVVLRCMVGRALSWVLVTLFGNVGRTFSRGADVLGLSVGVRILKCVIPNLSPGAHSSIPFELRRRKGSLCLL
jgi:hypothetical protein